MNGFNKGDVISLASGYVGLWCSIHFTGSPKAEDHRAHFAHVAVNPGGTFCDSFLWTEQSGKGSPATEAKQK